MSKLPEYKKGAPDSSEYTHEYYEKYCDGFIDFFQSEGWRIPLRLEHPLNLAEIKAGMKVVDIGCGRGEIIFHSTLSNATCWGIDYSSAAVEIARNTLDKNLSLELKNKYVIIQGEASQISIKSSTIDRVFMLDIVEHLTPLELDMVLQEVYRILAPEGKIIVHTMPSLWYYKYGYPIYRFSQLLRGVKLPEDPRARCDYSHFHINEQTPISLRKVMVKNGFQVKLWLETTQTYENELNLAARTIMNFLVKTFPFKIIFCNDIYAIGTKS